MKSAIRYAIPFLIILAGCSMMRPQQSGSLFVFEYEGQDYEIAGFSNPEGEAVNMLIQRDRENEKVQFRVMDQNQTGVLDQVLTGDISLKEANKIYHAGIRVAQQQDQYRSLERERVFETETEKYRLIVESYLKNEDSPFNRFVIYDLNWNLLGIYFDEGSDATLNRQQEAEIEMTVAQELYMRAIERAGEKNMLDKSTDRQVIISQESKTSIPQSGVISE